MSARQGNVLTTPHESRKKNDAASDLVLRVSTISSSLAPFVFQSALAVVNAIPSVSDHSLCYLKGLKLPLDTSL